MCMYSQGFFSSFPFLATQVLKHFRCDDTKQQTADKHYTQMEKLLVCYSVPFV